MHPNNKNTFRVFVGGTVGLPTFNFRGKGLILRLVSKDSHDLSWSQLLSCSNFGSGDHDCVNGNSFCSSLAKRIGES